MVYLVKRSTQGFSLVELSIVLVILGLLTGGVISGQSLIRAAELRSVITEAITYQTAIYTFQEKYAALPGDMSNAESLWGTDPNGCPTHSVRIAKKQTCNGNGSGEIAYQSPEAFRIWQHLANAELISSIYTGVTGSAGPSDYDFGSNAPISRLRDAGWGLVSKNVASGTDYNFAYNYVNVLFLGNAGDNIDPDGPVLENEEAYNIDNKLDDGKPGYGKIMASGIVVFPCTTVTVSQNYTATYNLTDTTRPCSLVFWP